MKTFSYQFILSIVLMGAIVSSIVGCEKPPVTASQQSSSQASVDATDLELTGKIRSALLFDASTAKVQIDVVVTKGDARLTGEVATQQQADQVVKVATAVEGVHTIHNELSVKK